MKYLILLIALAFIIGGCAQYTPVEIPTDVEINGFWDGFVHGLVLPFSLWAKILGGEVDIYATYNNGENYAVGFLLGFGSLGTTAAQSHKLKKK